MLLVWFSIGFAVILGALSPMIFKKKDSQVEETCEAYIKNQTGWEVDFSPEQQEKDKP